MPTILSDDAPPCLLVLFGATGDLTQRLLLPSLYNLAASHLLPDGFTLLGTASEDWTEDKFRDHIRETLLQFWGPDAAAETVTWLQQRVVLPGGELYGRGIVREAEEPGGGDGKGARD